MFVMLLPNKYGSWRTCMDCRVINNINIKYQYLIPRLDSLLEELFGACYFLKIDLRNDFQQIIVNYFLKGTNVRLDV